MFYWKWAILRYVGWLFLFWYVWKEKSHRDVWEAVFKFTGVVTTLLGIITEKGLVRGLIKKLKSKITCKPMRIFSEILHKSWSASTLIFTILDRLSTMVAILQTFLINILITSYLLDAPQNANGVKLADTLAPTVSCPDNIISTSTQVTLPQCTGFNNGGIGYVFFEENRNSATNLAYPAVANFNAATTTFVECEVRDSAGNLGTCIYAITINRKWTILHCIEILLSLSFRFEMSK